jgi:hypothetical protein
MPDINLQKQDFPFLFGGNGTLTAHLGVIPLDQPLTGSDNDLATLQFGAAGDTDFVFGSANQLKLSVTANSNASLMGLWPKSAAARLAVLADYGLQDFFSTHPDNLLLVLRLGASAGADLAATFPYSILTASATLSAGGNVGYTFIRPNIQTALAKDVFHDFLTNIRLPSDINTAPEPGEVIAYEFGGYLNVGAGLSVGYEIKGAPDLKIADLQLSEHYDLSVIGKLSIAAALAGQFGVQVTSASDGQGNLLQGWARVTINRKRSDKITVSADVDINATSDLQGLPDTGKDFLGALLGVNVKNWLNVLQRVHDLSDFSAIQNELDGLAKKFIGEWVGKVFDELPSDFSGFLQKVQKVVDSYNNLDNSAITLFDKYFSQLNVLTTKLNDLINLTSWDQLKGEIDPDLWNIVRQLTDGDPLTWILGQITIKNSAGQPITIPSLPELKKRVQQTLDLIQSSAHDEIRQVIALAKQSFPLDSFLQQVSAIDSVPKLKAIFNQKLGDFVERLTGKILATISSNSDLNALVSTIQKVTSNILNFENGLYDKLKSAAKQSFSLSLQAGYDRSAENGALIDLAINLSVPSGMTLFKAATQGDFSTVLAAYQPDLVRLYQGALTHNITSETNFAVNVLGWHSGWHYQGFDKVIVNTDQQIVAEKSGGLTVYSTVDLKVERDREMAGNRLNVNLLLRFVGESHGLLQFDAASQQYLIDAITGMSGSYGLQFDRKDASIDDVRYVLQFAPAFGLVSGATPDNVIRFMKRNANGRFGPVSADYAVQYTELGLRRFFLAPFDTETESFVRKTIRKVVLANYLQDQALADVGWVYFSDATFQVFEDEGPATFTNHLSDVDFNAIDPSPFPLVPNRAAPVTMTPQQLQTIATLYLIEDDVVSGLAKLEALIQSSTPIKPHDFENALSKFGHALDSLEGFANGVNAIFAVFDQLILQQVPAKQARESSLELTFQVGGSQKTLPFLSPGSAVPTLALARGA